MGGTGRLALVWLLVGGVALAAPDGTRRAKEAFIEGTSLFNLGKFDKAIEKWEEGYQAKPDPIFLYNIAQAYRLKGDLTNALFFYRNFLRNAPQAVNRDEVDEKIRKLEVAVEAQKRTRESPPDEALPPPTVTGKKPKPPEPEPPAAPPPQMAPVPVHNEPSVSIQLVKPRRHAFDLAVAGGVQLWTRGLPGGVEPGFGFTIGGGYDAWARGRVTLRVGAKLGYSFLRDVATTVSLISLLAEPTLRVALWRDRLHLFVAVGVGALLLDGVAARSGFLVDHATATGVLGAFELRPALGIEYRPISRLALLIASETIYSPSPDAAFLDGALLRFTVTLGAAVRL